MNFKKVHELKQIKIEVKQKKERGKEELKTRFFQNKTQENWCRK